MAGPNETCLGGVGSISVPGTDTNIRANAECATVAQRLYGCGAPEGYSHSSLVLRHQAIKRWRGVCLVWGGTLVRDHHVFSLCMRAPHRQRSATKGVTYLQAGRHRDSMTY